NLENSFVIIVGPDSGSSAGHAMNVRVQTLLDTSLLDQLRRPRLVRQWILQRGSDIDKLARDLRIRALGAARRSDVDPSPHTGKIGLAIRGARGWSREVGLSVRSAWHTRSWETKPVGGTRRRRDDENDCGRIT